MDRRLFREPTVGRGHRAAGMRSRSYCHKMHDLRGVAFLATKRLS
jgi:hypothetical protein